MNNSVVVQIKLEAGGGWGSSSHPSTQGCTVLGQCPESPILETSQKDLVPAAPFQPLNLMSPENLEAAFPGERGRVLAHPLKHHLPPFLIPLFGLISDLTAATRTQMIIITPAIYFEFAFPHRPHGVVCSPHVISPNLHENLLKGPCFTDGALGGQVT